MVYSQVFIGSEIFYRLRSSKYTPSVTPVGRDSSLREGAGNAIVWPDAIHRTAQKPQRCGRFSSPLRNSECLTALNHRGPLPQSRPLGVTAPSGREPGTPSSGRVPFTRPPGNHDVAGDFHRPYETQLPCNQSNVSRVVVYSWQVTPDLSPVMGRGLADRAFSRRSAAWGRLMWRRSMASAFRMLWGLA